MSRGKRQLSLIGQVDARLNGMLALGQSKHQAKMDKQAMLTVSQALGHNRISVVGEHYITV